MSDHPILPTGYNSTAIGGDEVNGAGVNQSVWPALFDSYVGLRPLVMTADMLAAFTDLCPDIVFPAENDTIVFVAENDMVVIRRAG